MSVVRLLAWTALERAPDVHSIAGRLGTCVETPEEVVEMGLSMNGGFRDT